MAQKPSIPKGTRDFSPIEVAKRQYIISVIKKHFERNGFQPIETPSFENSETLMGKYGEEGDRLIFKILNSGDFLEKYNKFLIEIILDILSSHISNLKENGFEFYLGEKYNYFINENLPKIIKERFNKIFGSENKINEIQFSKDLWFYLKNYTDTYSNIEDLEKNEKSVGVSIFGEFYYKLGTKYVGNYISEKALRYDLTVPFARFVVQHQNELEFPFKRYQIQPVWRADRPQKGRFREFYQCDADVVGSTSLWQEVELVQLYDAVFSDLKVEGVTIKINNRKILSGIAEVIGASDKLIDFTVALDKLDKIGEDGVKAEMLAKGISEEALFEVQPLFNFNGSLTEKLNQLRELLASSVEGTKGVDELTFICETVEELGLKSATLNLDVTLARGLNYYTGAIFEVAAPETVKLGSIGGGGRYDDLTGIFGLKNMSGVGISFGLDRIYLVIEELNVFPETVSNVTDVLFLNFGDNEAKYCLKVIRELREAGVNAELYPDKAKMAKQFQFAEKKGIKYAVIVGETEMQQNIFGLKNLISGEQQNVTLQELKQTLLK
ncbi:histidine--tRNA ligase [Paenimyroides baculatum]|uniref:Histidine--tRNA ligase n=1 Tax=Paenimyroides baculatum TaxID=2608000 RepID=A0A5M6CS27_9FLAO|nr:histidine--tRNA ligase [Paenimyroides baculatum]KAA5535939.1 histidine--tRNA ligase [Paenimyroides baculatum]